MAERIKLPQNVSKDELLNQIRCGVHDAMHELLMSGGSASPGDNFFSAVRDGVREAVRATVTTAQLRVVPDAPEPGAPAAQGEAKP